MQSFSIPLLQKWEALCHSSWWNLHQSFRKNKRAINIGCLQITVFAPLENMQCLHLYALLPVLFLFQSLWNLPLTVLLSVTGYCVPHWHNGNHWPISVMDFVQRQNATRNPSRFWNTFVSPACWEVKGRSVFEGISYPYVSRRFIYLFTEGRRGPESHASNTHPPTQFCP